MLTVLPRRVVALFASLLLVRSGAGFQPTKPCVRSTIATAEAAKAATTSSTLLRVASADTPPKSIDISDLRRGMGGRIEEAFAAAKAKGQAAFVTFVTAGYPTAQGMCARLT
jgi:hypothetical protein